MSKYSSCPSCGTTRKDFSMLQCKNCGYIGCYGGTLVGGGCYGNVRCPSCDSNKGSNRVGFIG